MVNSKKSSKSLIALVVMAILLVASIVLGATGAWFTSYRNVSPEDLTFGNIEIEAAQATMVAKSVSTQTTDLLMPGDKLEIAFSVENVGNAAWIAANVTVKVVDGEGNDANPSNLAEFKAMFEGWYLGVDSDPADDANETGLTDLAFDAAGYTAEDATKYFAISELLDGDKYKDEWEELTVQVTIEVYALQAENRTNTEAAAAIIAEHAAQTNTYEEGTTV